MQVGFINKWYDRFYLYITITNSKYTFSLAKENFKAIEIVQRCLLVQVIIIHKHDYYTLLLAVRSYNVLNDHESLVRVVQRCLLFKSKLALLTNRRMIYLCSNVDMEVGKIKTKWQMLQLYIIKHLGYEYSLLISLSLPSTIFFRELIILHLFRILTNFS